LIASSYEETHIVITCFNETLTEGFSLPILKNVLINYIIITTYRVLHALYKLEIKTFNQLDPNIYCSVSNTSIA